MATEGKKLKQVRVHEGEHYELQFETGRPDPKPGGGEKTKEPGAPRERHKTSKTREQKKAG